MKKITMFLLAVCMLFQLTSCIATLPEANAPASNVSEAQKENPDKEDNGGDTQNAKVPVTVDQISVTFEIVKREYSEDVYVHATYQNNSEYPISDFDIDYLIKSSNETGYLFSNDTVRPGETSPRFTDYQSAGLTQDDIEILTCSYTVIVDNKDISIEYDRKLDRYTTFDW